MYKSEDELYPDVINWLQKVLSYKYKRADVKAYNTSRENLSEFLRRKKLGKYFSEFETFVIKVDITGVILTKDICQLAFVECKLNEISLKDISQIIGYSKVVKPAISMITSPKGVSRPVHMLFNVFKRYDILNYVNRHEIKIGTWNVQTNEIDPSSIIPYGKHI